MSNFINYDLPILTSLSYYKKREEVYERLKKIGFNPQNIGIGNETTYSDVINFFSEKGVFITIEPVFTFATNNHIAYQWTITTITDEAKLKKLTQEDFSSFPLCLDESIDIAINIFLKDESNENNCT